MRSFPLLATLVTSLTLMACGGETAAPGAPHNTVGTNGPGTGSSGAATSTSPGFLSVTPGTATLAATQVSFWAVKGQDREAEIWYRPDPGAIDSTRLVRFRVDKRSLCNRVNGTPIATGDSLRITLSVIDPVKQIVQFEPAGLLFCAGRPAQLNLWYLEASHDLDRDGDVDAADRALERTLRIWRQEGAGQPWLAITSLLQANQDEVEADIGGFTNYVVAY